MLHSEWTTRNGQQTVSICTESLSRLFSLTLLGSDFPLFSYVCERTSAMWTLAVTATLWGLCVADLIGRDLVVYDCSNANGVVWWGCGSYGLCQGGQYSQIDCGNGTVYNRQAQQCTPTDGNVPYPCGNPPPDCSPYIESPGHRRPVTQPDTYENRPACSYYYTCSYGRFLGYQACPNEQVYDEGEQRCDLNIAVPPPCGVGSELSGRGQGQTRSPFQGGPTRTPGQGLGQTRNPNPGQQGQGQTRPQTSGQFTNSPFSGNNPNTGRNPQQGQTPGQGQSGWGSQGQVYGGQAPGYGSYGGQGQGQGGSPGTQGQVRGGQTYGPGQGQGQGQEVPRTPEESWYWY